MLSLMCFIISTVHLQGQLLNITTSYVGEREAAVNVSAGFDNFLLSSVHKSIYAALSINLKNAGYSSLLLTFVGTFVVVLNI